MGVWVGVWVWVGAWGVGCGWGRGCSELVLVLAGIRGNWHSSVNVVGVLRKSYIIYSYFYSSCAFFFFF